MANHLDYGVGKRGRSRFGQTIKIATYVVLGVLLICCLIFFVLISDSFTAWQTPPLGDLLRTKARLRLPDSFADGQEEIHGGITPTGYFSGTVAPADVSFITTQLQHASRTDIQLTNPPVWAKRRLWTDCQTYLRYEKGHFVKLHISPSTGNIEVEWQVPFVD